MYISVVGITNIYSIYARKAGIWLIKRRIPDRGLLKKMGEREKDKIVVARAKENADSAHKGEKRHFARKARISQKVKACSTQIL